MAVPLPVAQCPSTGRWAAQSHERADAIEIFLEDSQAGRLRLTAGHIGDLSAGSHSPATGAPPTGGQAPTASQTPAAGQNHIEGSISSWLNKDRAFHPQLGGLRLLLVDRLRYGLDLPIQGSTFRDVIDGFNLSPMTLQSFDCDAGTYSRTYVRGESGEVTGVRVILKAPQKRGVANYGLSMHYDILSKVTTALLFGTDIIVCQPELHPLPRDEKGEIDALTIRLTGHPNFDCPKELEDAVGDNEDQKEHKKAEREKWYYDNLHQKINPDIDRDTEAPKEHFQRSNPKLLELIESRIEELNHPLALPCLLLEHHRNQVHESCEHGPVQQKTWEILNDLGMRSDDRGDEHLFWIDAMALENAFSEQGAKDRFDAKKLTAKLDRHILRILFFQRSPEWNMSCSKFLFSLAKEINDKVFGGPAPAATSSSANPSPATPQNTQPARFSGLLHETLKESLEYNMEICSSVLTRLESMRQNMQLQLEVCGSITDQSINEFNARIAWDTSRDSTSMKILAVITAFFLPGTFVATFMSMGIWNWQWTDDPGPNQAHQNPGVVSPHWAIYIKAAIPLTAATVAGWILWWVYEIIVRENNYMKTVDATIEGSWVETRVRRALRWRRDMRAALATSKQTWPTKLIGAYLNVRRVRTKEAQQAEQQNKKLKDERMSKDRDKWTRRTAKYHRARENAALQAGQAPGQTNQSHATTPSQQPNGIV